MKIVECVGQTFLWANVSLRDGFEKTSNRARKKELSEGWEYSHLYRTPDESRHCLVIYVFLPDNSSSFHYWQPYPVNSRGYTYEQGNEAIDINKDDEPDLY
jgi:hypothetical protein